MKSVELIERALVNSSKSGDYVLDLFGGSGSTLIACERRNRNALLMEIDPKYCDVIVKRYQKYTGKFAMLAQRAAPSTT
jgi:DNA modification methylase